MLCESFYSPPVTSHIRYIYKEHGDLMFGLNDFSFTSTHQHMYIQLSFPLSKSRVLTLVKYWHKYLISVLAPFDKLKKTELVYIAQSGTKPEHDYANFNGNHLDNFSCSIFFFLKKTGCGPVYIHYLHWTKTPE